MNPGDGIIHGLKQMEMALWLPWLVFFDWSGGGDYTWQQEGHFVCHSCRRRLYLKAHSEGSDECFQLHLYRPHTYVEKGCVPVFRKHGFGKHPVLGSVPSKLQSAGAVRKAC